MRLVNLFFVGAISTAYLIFSTLAYADANSARINALAWLYQHQNGDGSWGNVAKTQATYNALLAIGFAINQGANLTTKTHGNTFNSGLAWMSNLQTTSIDSKALQLLSLYNNVDVPDTIYNSLIAAQNVNSTWGSLPGYAFNVADTSLALSALYSAPSYNGLSYTTDPGYKALCQLLHAQSASSGGWSYLDASGNAPQALSNPSIVPTSFAIRTIGFFMTYGTTLSCPTASGSSQPYTLKTVVDKGISFLLTKQHSDQGFGDSANSAVLESSLVYNAIGTVDLNHPALAQISTYIQNTQLANGSWGNDVLQTSYALLTLPRTPLNVSANDGIPDVVKAVINNGQPFNPRDIKPGNGQGTAGTTTPTMLPQAYQLGSPYAYTLPGSGIFKLISGALPDGLSLSSNGLITGVATTVGSYVFSYQINNGQILIARIDVTSAQASAASGDVPLPEWAVAVMALLLMLISMTFGPRRRPS